MFTRLYSHLYFVSFFSVSSADTHLSFFLFRSPHPLDLFCFADCNAISISALSLTPLSLLCSLLRERDFSEVDLCYFLLEYKLTSPQFTSAHLLGCLYVTFCTFAVWLYLFFPVLKLYNVPLRSPLSVSLIHFLTTVTRSI